MKFRDALKDVLTKDELAICPTSFDQVGDIAIIEVPEDLVPKQKEIGQTLLGMLKHINVVVKKHGIHGGKYRLQQYRLVAGQRRKTTIHKENGVRLKLHIEKTYYSMRSSGERLRVAQLTKPNENVLVMFSGIAPFPLSIAKNSSAKHITAIELNPYAHNFAQENLKLNKKLTNITLINGDVREVIPKLNQYFDRIVMPLPKDAELFLPDALKAAKKGTKIHLYRFGRESEFDEMSKETLNICNTAKRQVRIDEIVKAGHYAPYVYRLCFDITVLD